MIHVDDLWANNIDSSIDDVIGKFPELFDDFDWVLVTSLDSSRDLNKDAMIQKTGLLHRFLGSGALFEGRAMRQLILADGMFSGFDELWCFRHEISIPMPTVVQLVGPLQINTGIPNAVQTWMKQSKCVLGLGDGTGLNYITIDPAIAKLLDPSAGDDGIKST